MNQLLRVIRATAFFLKKIVSYLFVFPLSTTALVIGLTILSYGTSAIADTELPSYYRIKTFHNPDGIGKYYMDREIAHVMGHQAKSWLERNSREREENPQAVVEHLDLQPESNVADIGTGTGYFATRIASLVPQGTVYAVDVQPEMLEVVERETAEQNLNNIKPVLGTEDNPNLPVSSIDLALMVDAYHEFAYPREMMSGLYDALKPGGKVVLVEYRQENPMIMIKPLHKMSQKQVKKEMKAVNLKWVKTQEFLPEQHFMIFQKPSK